MFVDELIKKLERMDPDLEVKFTLNTEDYTYDIELESLGEYTQGAFFDLEPGDSGLGEDDFEDLRLKVVDWAEEKELTFYDYFDKQYMKFLEEAIEFRLALEDAERINTREAWEAARLEYGDVLVTLIILAEQTAIDPLTSLRIAYDKIKDRKGKTIDGQFVKEEDLDD